MKNIYLIVGESGSGKTSIANKLTEKYGYKLLKSYTTRSRRYEGEDTYFFINDEVYEEFKKDIVAYTFYNNKHYFSISNQIEESDLYVIDPDGVRHVKSKYKGKKGLKIIRLIVDEYIRKQRIIERGDTEEYATNRIEGDRLKFNHKGISYDLEIDNNTDINNTIDKIVEFIIDCEAKIS